MVIKNGFVFIGGGFVKTDIEVKGRLIGGLGEMSGGDGILDCGGLKVIPGLVDVHTHGRMGHSFNSARGGCLELLLKDYAMCGVTTVLATVMTDSPETMEDACAALRDVIEAGEYGCRGINLEGPFLSERKKGAHHAGYLKNPSIEFFDKLHRASGEHINIISMAPELEGALEMTGRLRKYRFHSECGDSGVRVSLGHSACDYETAATAFDAGADHVTHAFNAMEGITARNPGIIPAALDKRAYIELICDGYHVAPSLLRMIVKAAPDRTVLISDSITPAGMPDGSYESGGQTVTKQGDRITGGDGVIAGSAISLLEGLRRCITQFGIDEATAVTAATFNPASAAGLEKSVGSIAVGMSADMVAVNDAYEAVHVVAGGKLLY